MPHILVKLRGHYAIWSTVVDAPVTPFVETMDDLRCVAPPNEDLSPERLIRVEHDGSSLLDPTTAEEVVSVNRAGPGETCLDIDELLAAYAPEPAESSSRDE